MLQKCINLNNQETGLMKIELNEKLPDRGLFAC